jgi:sugar (pentulose or hexulose) kinase
MTQSCLELLGADGPIIVEGPFAANSIYLHALAGFAGRDVIAVSGTTGTAMGAALLAGAAVPAMVERIFNPANEAYKNYKIQWLDSIN